MKHPDYNFVDTAMGGVDRRNHVVTAAEVRGLMPGDPVDCYCTWHRFPALYYQHWQENVKERKGQTYNSVGGYKGPSYADFVPFDIDGATLEESQHILRQMLGYIDATWGQPEVRISFSGNRGYHVSFPAAVFGGWDPSEALAAHLKSLALRICGDLVEVDPQVYDRNRLWRLINTINSKSGLYKIRLTEGEALGDVEAIKALARGPRVFETPSWEDAVPVAGLVELWQAAREEPVSQKKAVPVDGLFAVGLKEGEGRQQRAFDMVRQFRAWGIPPSGARPLLEMWNATLDVPLTETDGDDELIRIVENVYGDDPGKVNRITPDVVLDLDDLLDKYDAYVKLSREQGVKFGIPKLDNYTRGIAPGEVCTVIAKTSVGKTAFAQNVLRNLGLNEGTESLFLTMEQPAAQALERWAQMVTGLDGREINRTWSEDAGYRPSLADELRRSALDKVWTCEVSHLKPEEVEQVVWAAQGKGANPRLVVIDYLGLLDVKDLERSLYGQISEAARGLKTLAKNLNVAVVALCQVSRSPEDHGDKPLHLSSARESGAIEESCDYMLGLYRPHIERLNGQEDDTMVVQLLKNRKGRCGQVRCNFDGETLRITERAEEGAHADREDAGPVGGAPDFGGPAAEVREPVQGTRRGDREPGTRDAAGASYRESADRPDSWDEPKLPF